MNKKLERSIVCHDCHFFSQYAAAVDGLVIEEEEEEEIHYVHTASKGL